MVGKGIGRLTKGKFSEILGTLWSTSMKRENIVSGFVSTGLFPHDKTKFESEFDPIDLNNYYKNLHDDNSEENNAALNNGYYLETSDTVNPNIEEPIYSWRTPTPRLKTARYGEVLTTSEVLNRLKEAQEKETMKKPAGERGRPKKPLVNIAVIIVETSSEEEPEICNLSISSNDFNDDPLDLIEVINQRPEWSLIQPGVYILVDFLGGPRNKHHYKYICCVVSVDNEDGEIIVNGMKKEN